MWNDKYCLNEAVASDEVFVEFWFSKNQKHNSLNMRTILSKILQQGKISFYIKNSLNKFQKSDKPFIFGIF